MDVKGNSQELQLYIPAGITDHEDGIAPGIGKAEATRIAFTTLAGIAIGVILKLLGLSLTTMMILIIAIAAASVGFYKKENNVSLYEQCKWMTCFYKSNKFMPYTYLNEWGDEIEENR